MKIYSKEGILLAEVSKFQYNGTFMGESYLTFDIDSPEPVDFEIGAYTEYRGERYELNYTPAKLKASSPGSIGDAFKYKGLKFNSLADELTRCDFLDFVLNDNQVHFSNLPNFSFYAQSVQELADRLQANLNRVYTGDKQWTIIVDPSFVSTEQNVVINNLKCWEALQLVNSLFKGNFVIRGRNITIGTAGLAVEKIFGYGKDKGLFTIEQQTNNNALIITRLRAYGSTRNIPDKYYNNLKDANGNPLIPESQYVKNLMLPSFAENGGDAYIDSPDIDKLGVREGTVFFDGSDSSLPDIYPSLEGMTAEELKAAGFPTESTGELDIIVSAEQIEDNGEPPIEGQGEIQSTFWITIKDTGFNINDHLTTETAQISMKTGMCAGRAFDIEKCEKITGGYKLTLKRDEDSDLGLYFPYNRYNLKSGDKFVLLNIEMPEVYIKTAEQKLLKHAEQYLSNNDKSKYTYVPKIDSIFMARNPQFHDTLKEGDIFNFKDTDLGIDASVIIQSLTIKEGGIVPEYDITLFNDKIISGSIEKIQNQISSLANNLGITLEQAKSLFYTLINSWYPNWFDQKLHTTDNVQFAQVVAKELVEETDSENPQQVSMLLVEEGISEGSPTTLGGLTNVDQTFDTVENGKYLLENIDGIFYPVKAEELGAGIKLTLTHISAPSLTTVLGNSVVLEYLFTSIDESTGEATGAGTAIYTVNSARVATEIIQQGNIKFDCKNYLSTGDNIVQVTVTDSYGKSRTISYLVSVISLSISSPFDPYLAYSTTIPFRYTPIGAIDKNVIFIIDNKVIASVPTAVNNRQLTQILPSQPHGEHILEVYIEAEINGEIIRSNTLRYALICIQEGNNTPIIASSFNESTVNQYATISIPYVVYSPASSLSNIELKAEGNVISQQTVDRTKQTWNYRVDKATSPLALSIACGDIEKVFTLTVQASDINVEAETENLELYLTALGRSNNESDPARWENNGISASLTGFNFSTNGWIANNDGIVSLKVSGDARVDIPLKIFGKDFKATGKTIEFEFETMDVVNTDAVVVSCMNGGRGIQITANEAKFSSEQVTVTSRFKNNDRVRISFVVEDRAGSRLIYTYINGIISGVDQYPLEDNFIQANPVNISIGNNDCTILLHTIRVYNAALNQFQMLNNYVADMDDINTKIPLYTRNQIYDDYGEIVYSLVLNQIPIMTIVGDLPSFKGDKKIVQIIYENKQQPENSFISDNVQIDVQGTSSQYYPRKNYKTKHKSGFLMTSTGENSDNYCLHNDSIAVNTFCQKADFAESSGTHNTGMAKIIDHLLKELSFLTPPQKTDERIRTTIDGFPITVFHQATPNSAKTFLGKYNFNNDKSTQNTFGFSGSAECWEVRNNTSDRVLFKTSDYNIKDVNGTPEWLNDFESRYPDDDALNEEYANGKIPVNLKRLTDWIASTKNNPEKFKLEYETYFDKNFLVFYYIITELYAMIDQRAKNMMIATWDGKVWFPIFYDNDSCLGINNEGVINAAYNVEYHDTIGTQNVFNGAESVLWNNVETALENDVIALYQKMRSSGLLSYDTTMEVLDKEQSDKWSEAIYNADGKFKYIDPLIEEGNGSYLYAAQGSRSEYRKWWLYNRFLYIDSKYIAGDFKNDYATMRLYTPANWQGVPPNANFTIIPYADSYVSVKFGSYLIGQRSYKDVPVNIIAPDIQFNDTETIIYGASRLSSLGDLSAKYPGTIDVSKAVMLSELIIGSAVEGYQNTNLKVLSVGSNKMLRKIDIRNCPNLMQPVDLSGCENIEEIYAQGTAITTVVLPSGGMLKKLFLPATLRSLSLKNQIALRDEYFELAGIDRLSTIICENTTGIDSLNIIRRCLSKEDIVLERVRFTGVKWEDSNLDLLIKLSNLKGIDANGLNTENAVVTGSCHVATATESKLASVQAAFPELNITYTILKPDTVTTFIFSSSQNKAIVNSSLECNFPFVKVNETTYKVTAEDGNTIKLIFRCENHEDFTANYLVSGTRTQNYTAIYIPLRTIRVQVYGTSVYPVGASVKIGSNILKTDSNGYVYIRSGAAVEGSVSAIGYSDGTFSFSSITNDASHIIYVYIAVEVKFIVKNGFNNFVEGAVVTCNGQTAKTNLYGECILNLGKGEFDYTVTHQNYFDYKGKVTVGTSAINLNINILFNPETLKPVENDNIQMMFVGPDGEISINSTVDNYIISWGDGEYTQASGTGNQTYNHKYSANDFYQVEISNCNYIISCNGSSGCLVAYWGIGNSKVKGLNFPSFGKLSYVGLVFINENNRNSFSNCFYNCKNLINIPVGLFDNCPNVTYFGGCFHSCNNLTSIPVGLFDNCPNVSNFEYCFHSCNNLISIPVGLFDNCPNVTNFSYCFSYCNNLISIPVGLFDNCPNVTYFGSCFNSCNNLISIPVGLFDNCPNVSNFSYCFSYCYNLTSIPVGLFDNCPNVSNFRECFYSCNNLTNIPVGLFDNCPNVTNFYNCFSGYNNITSLLPPLWVQYYGKTVYKENCFAGCVKAENWLEVPKSWGGTADEYAPPATNFSGVVLADYRAINTRLNNIEEKLNLN